MKSTVTTLAPRRAPIFDSACLALHSVVDLPVRSDGASLLASKLEEIGLTNDARMIMFGYRNLAAVADGLFNFLGVDWPCAQAADPTSAVVAAVVAGIEAVRVGLTQQDTGRDFVVCNFLKGVGSIADDVAGLQAWGCVGEEYVEQWRPELGPFAVWANSGRFGQVQFFERELVSKTETDGVRLQILCQVATAKDLGLLQKYR